METPAQRKAKLKYRKAKRKQLVLEMSVEEFDRLTEHCEKIDTPKATFVKAAIAEKMEQSNLAEG